MAYFYYFDEYYADYIKLQGKPDQAIGEIRSTYQSLTAFKQQILWPARAYRRRIKTMYHLNLQALQKEVFGVLKDILNNILSNKCISSTACSNYLQYIIDKGQQKALPENYFPHLVQGIKQLEESEVLLSIDTLPVSQLTHLLIELECWLNEFQDNPLGERYENLKIILIGISEEIRAQLEARTVQNATLAHFIPDIGYKIQSHCQPT